MKGKLIDPRARVQMRIQFPSLCTIQRKMYTTEDSKQKRLKRPIGVPGHINIPCRMAARSSNMMSLLMEDVDNMITANVVRRFVRLNGYFPDINTRDMQAYIDGKVWEIRAIQADSEGFATLIIVEEIRP